MKELGQFHSFRRVIRRGIAAGALGLVILSAGAACRSVDGTSPTGPTPPSTSQNGEDIVQRNLECKRRAGEALGEYAKDHSGEPAAGGYNTPDGYYPTELACQNTGASGSSSSK